MVYNRYEKQLRDDELLIDAPRDESQKTFLKFEREGTEMLVLNVTFKCKQGMREEFLRKIIEEGIDVASRNEEFNYKYDFYIPVGEEAKDDLFLLEWWKDSEAHLAHREEPHYKRLGELKEVYVVDTVADRLREE